MPPESTRDLSGALRDRGYCIVRGALPATEVAALDRALAPAFEETPYCQGGFYGERTKRFGRHSEILTLAETILAPWCDTIQLNLTQAIALHPGALPQLPHRDQDMWRGVTGEVEYLVNVMWPLTGYRSDNGATLIWPGSHGAAALADPPPGPPIVAEMAPGDALVFLGSTLHGAGGNRSNAVRRGLIVSYCLGWLKPYENQWLAYPPEVARAFPRPLAELVGYRQHRPNLGNYEGCCPSVLLDGPVDTPLGAIDALRSDQAALVEAFVAEQRRQR
jgi:hypothetical protein